MSAESAVASAHRKHRVSAILAVCWLTIVVLSVLSTPLLSKLGLGYDKQNPLAPLQGPSAAHFFGTDSLGRDILLRLLFGGVPTLTGVLLAVAVALVLGVPFGMMAGYFGGKVERVLSVVADVLMSIPAMIVLLAAFAIFPNNISVIMSLMGVFSSAAIYRIVRGATLTIVDELYITAARAVGLGNARIVFRHLAPRLAGLIYVQASVNAALAFVMEVGLGFLGLDVTPPQPSWGGVIADASHYTLNDPWFMVPPTVVICLTILALGVLGDLGNRDLGSLRHRLMGEAAPQGETGSLDRLLRDDSILTVRGLTVTTAAGVALVENISFDVRKGEVVGLVGESGAGKSVTARAILRLDKDTRAVGQIVFEGQDISTMSESAMQQLRGKRIAFIGQDPMLALDPLFRVDSQLIEALRVHQHLGPQPAKEAAIGLLRSVRIDDPEQVARKYPFEISGGMAQRVAIALALAGDPELLIADEPTTALDVTVQMEVLGLLKSLQRERNLAIILVTHDWGVVADMCDRAVTMYAGEVVEMGGVDEIFADPQHPYTAALRRSDPHLQKVGDRLTTIPGALPPPGSWPVGCRFAARCQLATAECTEEHPSLRVDDDGRATRCLRSNALKVGV